MAARIMTSNALRSGVLGGYRRLLKTTRTTFRGDAYAIEEARKQIRDQFTANKNVSDPNEIGKLLAGVDEVDEFLKFHVVQGNLNNRGNYEVEFNEDHRQKFRKDEEVQVVHSDTPLTPNTEGCGKPGGCGCASGTA